MFSAVVQFIGLAIVYNLDKKTLTTMREELDERHAVADGGAQAE
jgi:Na+/melibiose symporter-like transporter